MIDVTGLTKKFDERIAVNDVSFRVGQGEIFAFLGPNGAGKSTTIKILTTLLRPTHGAVKVDGHDVSGSGASKVRKSLGVVFQDPSLDDRLTPYENMYLHAVMYGIPRKERRERIEFLLKLVELWERRAGKVMEFSGGMKRRLEIARGILHRPRVFLLDEPTVGLDPQTRHHIWKYLQEINLREGTTIFFTTHYMDEAERVAARVAVIDHGCIIANDTPAVLKRETGALTLEEAFLALTGRATRKEVASEQDHLRSYQRALQGGR